MKAKSSKPRIPKVVTISRKRWATPTKKADAALVTEHGTMCCLGFVCAAAGVPRNAMRLKAMPGDLDTDKTTNPLEMFGDFCGEAAEINDDVLISNGEREKKLRKLFRDDGPCRLRFVP